MNAIAHKNEIQRLKVLKEYEISKEREKVFDELTELVCRLTSIPRSLISIVDKDEVWFKSQRGLELNSSTRELSFCSHAINSEEDIYLIEDARKIDEFKDHPYVNAADPLIFYAGVKLESEQGMPLGTLCVLDNKPHKLTDEERASLLMVADLAKRQLELHKKNTDLLKQTAILEENNEMLKSFAHTVSHDMKMPLANMVLTTDIVAKKYGDNIDEAGQNYLNYIKDAAFGLSDYVTQILAHYESESFLVEEKETFDAYTLLEHIQEILAIPDDIDYILPEDNIELKINKSALEQILINLIGNALKYNDKKTIEVKTDIIDKEEYYIIKVADNGIGIAEDKKEDIFKMFQTLNQPDRNGKRGNGIGLSTVQKLVNKLNGMITVNSELGLGTEFIITLSK
ncbi:GAF domain-containing sensor histidine kinase [Nonlabens mediterrranea]|uniref:histidine kinase n=1 Tax=Nonlabens mediterrranea TaxID=1419947 RepID=A0ABS0A1Q5_9FLAO|nr:putative histidine kinase [Flavobacteria bacterium BBFL7]MBF4983264.1 GAF domain-containing sensor histidine kinase [Nonlabens mediterrranea]